MERIRGHAWCYGDDVGTEHILPSQYLKLEREEAARHVMEGIDLDFARQVGRGDIVVAGRNFGAGSTREMAAHALKLARVAPRVPIKWRRGIAEVITNLFHNP